MVFGERLKAARLKKGLKQRELAEMIKSRNTALCNWENGTSAPTASIVELLSQALGISPFDLLGDFTLRDIQTLNDRQPSELSFEETAAVTFANYILSQGAAIELPNGVFVFATEYPEELLDANIKDIEKVVKSQSISPAVNDELINYLMQDGGMEVLLAYDYLNDDGRALLIDYLSTLIRTPLYLVEGEGGIDAEMIAKLQHVKRQIQEDVR